MIQIEVGVWGWLLLQGTLVALAGVMLAALAPGLSASGRARISLGALLLMSVVGLVGTGSLAAWSWGDWLRGFETAPGNASLAPASQSLSLEQTAPDSAGMAGSDAGSAETPPATEGLPDWAIAIANALLPAEPLHLAATGHAPMHRGWLAIIGTIVAAQMLGLARLLWGALWVARCRRRSVVVDAPAMQAALEEVARELGLRRRVTIAELADLSTPAVIGWRQPVLLLPSDWRTWSSREQRAVLAHELAHVQRRDFLTTAAAGIALVPQFYHPLAHLLTARMRVEQELAADALACGPAGGQERYLRALAGLALRRADARTGWPASAFLPTRRMFIRRIEMLRTRQMGPPHRATLWNAAAGLALLAVAVAVTGLRPTPAVAQQNDQPEVLADDAAPRREPQHTSAPPTISDPVQVLAGEEVVAIVDLDLRQLRQSPQYQASLAWWPSEVVESFEKLVRAPLENVQRVTIGFASPMPSAPLGRYVAHVVTYVDAEAAEATDAPIPLVGDFAVAFPRDEVQNGTLDRARMGQTMVLYGAERTMSLVSAALFRQPPADSLAARLLRFDSSGSREQKPPVRLAIDMVAVRPAFQAILMRPSSQEPMIASLEPLVMDVDTLLLGATVQETLEMEGRLECRSPEAAERVAETLRAVRVLAGNVLRKEIEPGMDSADRVMGNAPISAARGLVESLEFTSRDSSVIVRGQIDAPQTTVLAAAMVPMVTAVQQTRLKAMQLQSLNNLKSLGLAFHQYFDSHGHLPSAVIEGPEGVKRSWRVELLPYFGAGELYERYRKDEPWDSEHNLQVLAKMPPVFRHPSQPVGSTDSAYLTVLGEDTALSGDEPKFQDFTDGLSNTILVVESKRGVPWTKPEDLPMDLQAILNGGFGPEGVPAVWANGRVHALSEETDPDVLRKLLTRSGGEPIESAEMPWFRADE